MANPTINELMEGREYVANGQSELCIEALIGLYDDYVQQAFVGQKKE